MFKNILDFFYRKINYFWGFVNFSFSFYIVLSILSYNQSDVSYNKATSGPIKNFLGSFGSMVADPLLQLFGPSIIFYSVFLTFWGVKSFRNEKIKFPLIKTIFSIFSLFILSFFFNMIPSMEWWPFNYFGGIVGQKLHESLKFTLGNIYISPFILLILLFFFSCFSLSISFKDFKNFLCNFFRIFLKIPQIFSYKIDKNTLLNDEPEEEFEEKLIPPAEIDETTPPKASDSEKFTIIPRKEEKKSFFNKPSQNSKKESFILPSSSLLNHNNDKKKKQCSEAELQQNANLLIKVLKDFGVRGEIMDIYPGPVVTLYEFKPSAGTKSSRVIGLADDIARSMSSISARISVIPGKDALGIELPNSNREMVYLRELLESAKYKNTNFALPIILGKDISGEEKIVELAKMPHLLVAGTTGSGKSVAINTMILSLLFHHSPSECKFIMIDPKMLELSVYDDIPHLLTPVVTDPTKAIIALKWAVKEMENRYKLMSNLSVRNITSYNERLEEALAKKEVIEKSVQTGYDVETGKPIYEKIPINMEKLPLIVVIVDEMADLMLVAGKEIESSIQRLAQMARAAGIHIIMATQRPSVDVITGVIKANFPTRISFQVTSKIDSRTILSEQGAEQLLGMGDMLYMSGGNKVIRVHGPFVSDQEVEKIVSYLKSQGAPQYIEDITAEEDENSDGKNNGENQENDPYFQAVSIVKREGKASTSYIQRCLSIGYNRAALIIERMEKEGIVSKADHVGRRVVLVRD